MRSRAAARSPTLTPNLGESMKVKELIERLDMFKPDQEVVVIHIDYDQKRPRHEVVSVQADNGLAAIVMVG